METIKHNVKQILTIHPHTRGDINALVKQMLSSCYGLHAVGYERAFKLMPSIKSIERIERALRKEYPHLECDKEKKRMLKNAENDYRARYSRQGNTR